MPPSEVAATHDPGGPPPGRIDVSWLILQRLEDIKRDQDRLRAEFDGLRQELDGLRREVRQEINDLRRDLDQKFTRLTGWFVTGLVGFLGTVIGLRFLP